MNSQRTMRTVNSLFLHVLSFFLLWEWLRPVEQLTGTNWVVFFLGFAAGSLLLAFLGAPRALSALLKGIYMVVCIQFFHYSSFTDMLQSFPASVLANMEMMIKGQFIDLSNAFRTLLFFVLLWITVYLIHYWLMLRQTILFFFLATIVFITVLDTFTPYSAQSAIVRAVVTGFFMMGILAFQRLSSTENLSKPGMAQWKWLTSLAVLVAASAAIAFTAPKADPLWPNPVPFIKSIGGSSGLSTNESGQSGFRSDDSSLGGPFRPANVVVFTAEVEEEHYWKVDTRDAYTGKGWVASNPDEEARTFRRRVPDSLFSFTEAVPAESRTSIVYNEEDYGHIQYPHGLERIGAASSFRYSLNTGTSKITPFNGEEPDAPDSYAVQYQHPSFQARDLQESTPEDEGIAFRSIQNQYTQLPDSLPEEVRQLALEITAGHDTTFDKVKAIESYFSASGFTYEQEDVPVPAEDEDYVAQFLFDTKQGYCDNFSTSMAVMLRTLDIPSRWVKGYTEGSYLETLDSGNQLYQVTSENAHSWVEVYFPGIGWVPFEPTQGFTNEAVPEVEDPTQTPVNEETPEDAETPADTPEQPVTEELTPVEEELIEDSSEAVPANEESFLQRNGKQMALLAAAALILSVMVFKFRRKWLPFYSIFQFKKKKEDRHFPEAYLVLLTQLERSGLKREKGQTLGEYAKEIDTLFSGTSMNTLTAYYEQYMYRNRLEPGTWSRVHADWEQLMHKTRTMK